MPHRRPDETTTHPPAAGRRHRHRTRRHGRSTEPRPCRATGAQAPPGWSNACRERVKPDQTADLDHLPPGLPGSGSNASGSVYRSTATPSRQGNSPLPNGRSSSTRPVAASERARRQPGHPGPRRPEPSQPGDGRVPASAAIDLRGARNLDRAGQARFYALVGPPRWRGCAGAGCRVGRTRSGPGTTWAGTLGTSKTQPCVGGCDAR